MDSKEEGSLNIAVLSGKGGTGKTTISTNLALALKANYIDCDVEEPNGFLFLTPEIKNKKEVMVEYPFIDDNRCISCGECAKVCQFNALAKVNKDIVLFQKLCHSCGACEVACKNEALSYRKRSIGTIERGQFKDINCIRGVLNISEPMAVPIIRNLLEHLPKGINLIDCPPGTSCNVVNSLKYVDAAILVTEPTEFGLHDLRLAVELVKMFNIPFGIIINKDNEENNITKKYCKKENINIIGSIPYSRDIAKIYSQGKVLYAESKYRKIFNNIALNIKEVLAWN